MFKVFIDPGHGGEDSGAIGPTGVMEKHLNMQTASLFSAACRRKGWDVMWSRNEDINVSESGSTRKANAWNADVYVALHVNGAGSSSATGYEILYWNTSQRGKKLAEQIVSNMKDNPYFSDRIKRGAKPRYPVDRGATVLLKTHMPAIIVEPGFISNAEAEVWLQRFSTQAIIAETIVEAIETCFFGREN